MDVSDKVLVKRCRDGDTAAFGVLVLHHMDGFSYEEISQKLHIGLSAAKMRVMRAREEFAHRIDGNGNLGNPL